MFPQAMKLQQKKIQKTSPAGNETTTEEDPNDHHSSTGNEATAGNETASHYTLTFLTADDGASQSTTSTRKQNRSQRKMEEPTL